MDITFAQQTDVGLQRDENQDALGYFTGALGRLFVVCDGMGGHAGGRLASAMAVKTIGSTFEAATVDDAPGEVLREAGRAANAAIVAHAAANPDLSGMGTTCVMLQIDALGEVAHFAHVGDSRLYRIRDEQMRQLTKDHTAVQRLVDQGVITQAQAPLHPHAGVISRTLGVDPDVEIDVSEAVELQEADLYLLCSDGLTTMVDDYDIYRYLDEYPVTAVADELVGLSNARGGYDNVTIQVVQIGTPRVVQGPTESGLARISDLIAESGPVLVPGGRRGPMLPVVIGLVAVAVLVALIVALR